MAAGGERKSMAIIGGGLVGSLHAMFMARKGFEVHLYESRNDIRKIGMNLEQPLILIL